MGVAVAVAMAVVRSPPTANAFAFAFATPHRLPIRRRERLAIGGDDGCGGLQQRPNTCSFPLFLSAQNLRPFALTLLRGRQ